MRTEWLVFFFGEFRGSFGTPEVQESPVLAPKVGGGFKRLGKRRLGTWAVLWFRVPRTPFAVVSKDAKRRKEHCSFSGPPYFGTWSDPNRTGCNLWLP